MHHYLKTIINTVIAVIMGFKLLLISAKPVTAQTSYQLWQVGGVPLSMISALGNEAGPFLAANPAKQRTNNREIGAEWRFQTGNSRKTLVEAMPRHGVHLPQIAGVQGNWHEVSWRAGYEQVYNSHEESRDSVGVWRPFDSRLEGLGFQLAMPVKVPYLTDFPQLMLGLGWTRYRLVMDQINAWSSVVAGDTTIYQYHMDRNLLADGMTLGLELFHHDLHLGLSWREETIWNHWDSEPLNSDSIGAVQVWGVLPEQWTFQLDVPANPGWSLSGQLQWTEWSASQLYLKDQLDMGLVVHGILPRLKSKVHAGFATSGTASSMVEDWGEERSTWFLLVGVETEFPRGVTASLKLGDSHLGSGEYRKQTIMQIGVKAALGARRP